MAPRGHTYYYSDLHNTTNHQVPTPCTEPPKRLHSSTDKGVLDTNINILTGIQNNKVDFKTVSDLGFGDY